VAYNLFIKPSAQKDLDFFPDREIKKIFNRLLQLKEEPRPIGVQKLTAMEGYRIRIGNYRILYEINEQSKIVSIYRIKHRKEVYK
jgi:mRNA interferase RelE/StbE